MNNLDSTIKQYILDSIDLECYDEHADDVQQAALKVVSFIMNEADHPYNRQKLISDQAIIADHIAGLPSYLNVAFSNYDIIQLGIKWGVLSEKENEAKEQQFLDNWFNTIAAKLLQISRGYHTKSLIWGIK